MKNHKEIQRTKTFIRELEEISGWPVSRMAKDAGFAHTTLSRFMKTENPKYNVKFSTLCDIATNLLAKLEAEVSPKSHQIVENLGKKNDGLIAVGTAPDDIERVWRISQALEEFGIPTTNNKIPLDPSSKELRIVEFAHAGSWKPHAIQRLSTETLKTLSYPYKLYPDTVVGVEVKDTSMNKRFPEGSILLCTPFINGAKTKTGDYYIVSCFNMATEETEITCKCLQHDDKGKPWLFPESTDPRYIPIALGDNTRSNDTSITAFFHTAIIAHVVGAIVKF